MEFSRQQFWTMVFYDFKIGLRKDQSLERLRDAFGNKSPSQATVYTWFKEFENGRASLEDEKRAGRPVTVVSDRDVLEIKRMLRLDNRITYTEIEATLRIESAAVRTILHDKLGLRKLCNCWMPYHLTHEQKQARVSWCQEMLQKFDNGCSEAMFNILTRDESWIYQYEDNPKAEQQSTMWIFPDETLPTGVKRIGKKMVFSFFCARGHIETITPKDQDLSNPNWYTAVCLPQVFEKLRDMQPGMGLKEIFLHHDNASFHSVAFLERIGTEILYHPPYSSDLAPCDFFLFPKAKECIRGQRFESLETAVMAYKEFLNRIPKEEWRAEFDKWFDRMKSCIRHEGEYCEKIHCNFGLDVNQNNVTWTVVNCNSAVPQTEIQNSNSNNEIGQFLFSLENAKEEKIDIKEELENDLNTYIKNTNENEVKKEIKKEQENDTMIGQYETVIIKTEICSEDDQEASKEYSKLMMPSKSEAVGTSTIKTTSPFIKVQSVEEINGMSENRARSLRMLQNLIQTPQYMQKQMQNNNVPISPKGTNITAKKENQSDLLDNNIKSYTKPAYSYPCLIAMALKNSPSGTLTVIEIYNYLRQHFPYFRTAPASWKNSIRYTLSMNKCFRKIPRTVFQGKGCKWAIVPNKIAKLDEKLQNWPKDPSAVEKAMVHSDRLEVLKRGEIRYLQRTRSKDIIVDTESSSDEDVKEITTFEESIQDCIIENSVTNSYEDDIEDTKDTKDIKDILDKQQNVPKSEPFDYKYDFSTKKHEKSTKTRRNAPLLLRSSIATCSFINIDD